MGLPGTGLAVRPLSSQRHFQPLHFPLFDFLNHEKKSVKKKQQNGRLGNVRLKALPACLAWPGLAALQREKVSILLR